MLSTASLPSLPYVLDLAGTFVFAISGAMGGVRHRTDLFGVPVLSFAAANTAGITRDLLLAQVPTVLRAGLYAVAALAGAAGVVIADRLQWPAEAAAVAGAAL